MEEFEDEIVETIKTDELIKDLIWYIFFMLLWVTITVLHAISMKNSPVVESLDIANIVLSSLLVGLHLNSSVSTLSKIIKAKKASKKS